MPRLVWPMKDVRRPRKLSGSSQVCFDPAVSEWNNPASLTRSDLFIYEQGVSRGTEISKYPEEKKSKEIPLVSDERTGKSPNPIYWGL